MKSENIEMNNDDNNESDQLSEFAKKASDKTEEMLRKSSQEIAKKYAYAEEYIVHYVQQNPWKSIGFSFLCGIIVASMLKK